MLGKLESKHKSYGILGLSPGGIYFYRAETIVSLTRLSMPRQDESKE